MPDYDFPNNPSTGATHEIGDKAWEFNGSAWEKTFSGDGIREIGITGSGSVSGSNALQFDSGDSGLTLSVTKSGNTANVKFTYDALKSTQGSAKYTYSVVTGALNTPNATSNGQFIYNDTTGALSIHKFDNSGADFRTELTGIANNGTSSKINVVVGSEDRKKVFEIDSAHATYSDPNLDVTSSFLQGNTAGTGKVVSVSIDQGEQFVRAQAFRFPDGTSAETIVTSFNGLTGDVTTSNLVLEVAGMSSAGGVTLHGDLSVHDSFHILNDDGNVLFDVASGRNITIGDVTGSGNSNTLLIRDSHDTMTFTTGSATFNTPIVNINNKLRHASDTNTHLAFPANDQIALTTNGVTLAHLTDRFTLLKGVSLNASGITFADGTHQSTAASGSGVTIGVQTLNGLTGNVSLSPGFEYVYDSDASASPASGKFDFYSILANFVSLHKTTNDGVDISSILSEFELRGGDITVMKADGTEIVMIRDVHSYGETSNVFTIQLSQHASFPTPTSDPVQVIDTTLSDGDVVYFKFNFYDPQTTHKNTSDFTTGFIIDGNGSPITTGDKLDALQQVPYGCHVEKASAYIQDGLSGSANEIRFGFKQTSNLDLFASAIGTGGKTLEIGRTGGQDQKGITFQGAVGSNAYFAQLTGVSNSDGSTLNAGDWIFPHIIGNSGDVTKLQVFLTLKGTTSGI